MRSDKVEQTILHNDSIDSYEQRTSKKKRSLDLGQFEEEKEMKQLKSLVEEDKSNETLKRKANKRRKKFNAEILISNSGTKNIYERFPSCKFKGGERESLANLISNYKSWAFQLFPDLAFSDIISRCEILGTKAHTRSCLYMLRERERNRYLRDTLGIAPDDIVTNINYSSESYERHLPVSGVDSNELLSGLDGAKASVMSGRRVDTSIEEDADLHIDWAAADVTDCELL